MEAGYIQKLASNSKKTFFMYDLDWHESAFSHSTQLDILNSFDRILCRNEDHKFVIDTHFGIDCEVLKEFTYEELIK